MEKYLPLTNCARRPQWGILARDRSSSRGTWQHSVRIKTTEGQYPPVQSRACEVSNVFIIWLCFFERLDTSPLGECCDEKIKLCFLQTFCVLLNLNFPFRTISMVTVSTVKIPTENQPIGAGNITVRVIRRKKANLLESYGVVCSFQS